MKKLLIILFTVLPLTILGQVFDLVADDTIAIEVNSRLGDAPAVIGNGHVYLGCDNTMDKVIII